VCDDDLMSAGCDLCDALSRDLRILSLFVDGSALSRTNEGIPADGNDDSR